MTSFSLASQQMTWGLIEETRGKAYVNSINVILLKWIWSLYIVKSFVVIFGIHHKLIVISGFVMYFFPHFSDFYLLRILNNLRLLKDLILQDSWGTILNNLSLRATQGNNKLRALIINLDFIFWGSYQILVKAVCPQITNPFFDLYFFPVKFF